VAVLRPLITANNTINANPGSNSLVITDYADNLRRLAQIVAALDRPSDTDVDLIPLKHAVATELAPLVQRLVATGVVGANPACTRRGGRRRQPRPWSPIRAATRSSCAPPTPPAWPRARRDRPARRAGQQRPGRRHLGRAAEERRRRAPGHRAACRLLGRRGGRRRRTGGLSGGLTGSRRQPGRRQRGQRQQRGQRAATTSPVAQPPRQPSTGGFIQADPATNSLIISAPEPLYRQVKAMIEQLDERRAQVYIESMIVEVSGDNAADFGFQWQGLLGNSGDSNLAASAPTSPARPAATSSNISVGAAPATAPAPPARPLASTWAWCATGGGTYALAPSHACCRARHQHQHRQHART
jgi:general secretion pathway protein D